MSKDYHIIPIFVPHIGCPHDCIFCNQRKIAAERNELDEKSIKNDIEKYLATIPNTNRKLEIAFFGGSFTGIDTNLQKSLLQMAYNYKRNGIIDRIRLSTRPDYIDKEKLDLLKQYDVDIVELGVQSMVNDVLYKSNRGHNSTDVINASKLIKDYGFTLGLQMMVGLPGSDYEKDIFTAKELIKLKPTIVRIYPTLVIKDTGLEKDFISGNFSPITLNEAVSICKDLLMLFNYNNVDVIRMGLQPTENISKDGDVIAGPFHPAFRQLVEEKIYREYLKFSFDKIDRNPNQNSIVKIIINKNKISNVVGQHSANIDFIKKTYGIKKVKVYGKEINKDSFLIYYGEKSYEMNTKEITEKYLIDKGLV